MHSSNAICDCICCQLVLLRIRGGEPLNQAMRRVRTMAIPSLLGVVIHIALTLSCIKAFNNIPNVQFGESTGAPCFLLYTQSYRV